MSDQPYFPESDLEIDRLENKTERQSVLDQAHWAGLLPGMRVLDVGCGPGITTACLAEAVAPTGRAIGLDRSSGRIEYARGKYATQNVEFVCRNFFEPLDDLGEFDFVWMRFVIEYFLKEADQLIRHVAKRVRPGGILCLADLDHNCLSHHGHTERLERAFRCIAACQMANNNFDPFAGRKLPTVLHDMGFEEIRTDVRPHHLVYGELSAFDQWNWWHKIELAGRRSGWTFDDYEDGFAGFEREFKEYLQSPRRFIYTPLIISCGVKPSGRQ